MPDVVWHPVSEPPTVGIHVKEFWVCLADADTPYADIGRYYPPGRANGHWKDVAGNEIDDVITHYAEIAYPEPPEEA